MRYRPFRSAGWQVSEIGYGMWGMGGWTGSDDAESLAVPGPRGRARLQLLRHRLAYGDGRSERLLGDALAAPPRTAAVRRHQDPAEEPGGRPRATPVADVFPADYIVADDDESLKNLGVERIDLQQLHVWSDAWAADDGWKRAVDDLKREGLIAGFGISVNRWEPANVLRRSTPGSSTASRWSTTSSTRRPKTSCSPPASALDVGRHRARPLRRRQPDRHADPGLDSGRRATGATSTSSPSAAERWRASIACSRWSRRMTLADLALRFILHTRRCRRPSRGCGGEERRAKSPRATPRPSHTAGAFLSPFARIAGIAIRTYRRTMRRQPHER